MVFYSVIDYTGYMQIKSSKKISLLELLQELAPESSKNRLRSWVEKGRVLVDGKAPKHVNQMVKDGQEVTVGAKPKYVQEDLKILYEDEDLVVIDKPKGLLSVATDLEKEKTVHALLKHRFHNRMVYPIHRLDQESSGLLVFAYTKEARDHLKEQLEKRTMEREYRALVHGHPNSGTWRCFLEEDARMKVHVTSHGKEAVTHFETIKKRGNCSLLKLKLESGRKHQIRVQAAHFGYPIVGDPKYGIPEDTGKSFQLRAVALSFSHLKTNKILHFRG
ncbi:MAG: Ribosomal large subunit pseudouridine synthase D [Chlamydiae bacterium]|nr:Ribosomal large subunit pseudouridine synthase D [Chlamydiota bacterium]